MSVTEIFDDKNINFVMVNPTTPLQQEIDAREESLLELLAQLKETAPLIPDAVTDYHMQRGKLSLIY